MLTADTDRNSASSFAVNALLHAAIVSAKVRLTVGSGPAAERAHGDCCTSARPSVAKGKSSIVGTI